tara:strand:- start:3979 stop:4191 length:213 start_codon:yes stop_codon:yes gene_type:complete
MAHLERDAKMSVPMTASTTVPDMANVIMVGVGAMMGGLVSIVLKPMSGGPINGALERGLTKDFTGKRNRI